MRPLSSIACRGLRGYGTTGLYCWGLLSLGACGNTESGSPSPGLEPAAGSGALAGGGSTAEPNTADAAGAATDSTSPNQPPPGDDTITPPASTGEPGNGGAGGTPPGESGTGAGGGAGGAGDMSPTETSGGAPAAGAGGTNEAGSGGQPEEQAGGGSGGQGEAEPERQPPYCDTEPATLAEAGECTGRLIGNAMRADQVNDASITTAMRDFNYLTPENEMKFDAIEPSPGSFNFGPADRLVDFAKQNGMKVKGHTLVWRYQNPSWLTNLTNASDVRAAMIRHIEGVMGHYKGNDTVIAWDVVNEAINNEGNGYWDSPFVKIGDSYVDEAFIAAREVDPNVKLYYNDYRADGMNAKSDAIYEMVRSMVERGIPIDGVGLQLHTGTPNVQFPLDEIQANMQRIADLGLEVVISEMDQHVCDGITPEQQAEYHHDVVAFCVALPECTAITFWGFDRDSWLNTWNETNCAAGQDPSGTLWNKSWMKKPAYYGVMDALNGL